MIVDLDSEVQQSRRRLDRPRVSSEPVLWAFLSSVGAGFIAYAIGELVLAVIVPPSLVEYVPWLAPFMLPRGAQLLTMGAVALRTGGLRVVALCGAYELLKVAVGALDFTALCERSPIPDPSLPCGLGAVAFSTWPTWLGLVLGAAGSRKLLPLATAGANRMLRALGTFTVLLTVAGIVWQVSQGAVYSALSALGVIGAEGSRAPSVLVVVSSAFLIIQLVVAFVAGVVLRRASPAAVVLAAIVVGYGAGLGIAQIRNNVDTGVPHEPLSLAYLQSLNALIPAAGVLGLALGRLSVRDNSYLRASESNPAPTYPPVAVLHEPNVRD